MNEINFVTFEQAKRLKELGFKEKCLYHYNDLYELQANIEGIPESYNTKNDMNWKDAPLLYQVKDWLREEKKIHIIIDIHYPKWNENDYNIIKYCFWYNLVDKTGRIIDVNDTVYDSYHEALSAAIDYPLNNDIFKYTEL